MSIYTPSVLLNFSNEFGEIIKEFTTHGWCDTWGWSIIKKYIANPAPFTYKPSRIDILNIRDFSGQKPPLERIVQQFDELCQKYCIGLSIDWHYDNFIDVYNITGTIYLVSPHLLPTQNTTITYHRRYFGLDNISNIDRGALGSL